MLFSPCFRGMATRSSTAQGAMRFLLTQLPYGIGQRVPDQSGPPISQVGKKKLPTPTFHPYSHHLTCFLITTTLLFNTYDSLINFFFQYTDSLRQPFKTDSNRHQNKSFLANTRSIHYFIKVFQYPGVVEIPPAEVHPFRCRRLPIQPSSAHHPGVNSGESPIHRDGPNASIEMANICM